MRTRFVVLAVAVVAASACSADEPELDVGANFQERLATFIEHAQEGGASPEQLAILQEAETEGSVPFDVYNTAVDRALRCLREAGYEPDDGDTYEEFGITWRRFGIPPEVESDPAEMVEVMPGIFEHRCLAEHSAWVHMAYGEQPAAIEAHEAYFEQFRDAVVACLAEQGVEVASNLSRSELELASVEAVSSGATEVDCLEEVGYR